MAEYLVRVESLGLPEHQVVMDEKDPKVTKEV